MSEEISQDGGSIEYIEWTKRLGQRHWAKVGFDSTTLCGRPMLGNNYVKVIPDNEKTDCNDCVQKMKDLRYIKNIKAEIPAGQASSL